MGLSPHGSADPRHHSVQHTTPTAPAGGVVWDLGDVLVRWSPVDAVAAGVGEVEARRFLAEFDFASWNHACDAGTSWDDALAVLERDHPRWLAHGRAYREHVGLALTGEVPGSADLLRTLDAAGVPQIALTNFSEELYRAHMPARFDFLRVFADVVVSGTEGLAKPDPAIYRLAAARIGLPLERLVFIDDRQVNVDAARSLGMTGVLFTDAEHLRADLRQRGLPV